MAPSVKVPPEHLPAVRDAVRDFAAQPGPEAFGRLHRLLDEVGRPAPETAPFPPGRGDPVDRAAFWRRRN